MIDRDALRSLIREVIDSEVARLRGARDSTAAVNAEHAIRIEGDADLAHFAKLVLALAENAPARERILAGAYPFRLAHGDRPGAPRPPGESTNRVENGLVTEATLARLAKDIKVLDLAPGVVVTPLARERARALGIALERRRA